jgi:nitrate reductase beta subunit
MLYDADGVTQAACADDKDLYQAQLDVLLDPTDPGVLADARRSGIPEDWLGAAQRSPVYALIKHFRVALPLHPEYRTMPMVWYIPPLSPVVDLLRDQGHDSEAAGNLFGAIDALRIPVSYLAELFTAGDTSVVTGVLQKLAAMRAYMRGVTLGAGGDAEVAHAAGMTPEAIEQMYRLLAIAKYDERYVVPAAHREQAHSLEEMACALDGGPGDGGPFSVTAGRPVPVTLESYRSAAARRDAEQAR